MAFSILELIGENCNWQNSRTVMALADNSMTIYLFHQQIIYFVIVALNGIVTPVINAFANFTISLAASAIIASILKKWRIIRVLLGEKS